MSYTAALKMPSSYAVMNEEEMTYLCCASLSLT